MKASTENTSSRERKIYRVTLVGSVVNFVLLLFKFFAGIAGHSAAMLADAVHSLSDFVTDIIVLVFVRLSSKPEDVGHDYGHGKYETLATAIIGLCLFVVGLGILWNGAQSIWHVIQGGTLPSPGMLALVAALVSIVSKEALYQYTVYVGRNLAPSQRRFFVHRYRCGHRRRHPAGRSLAGARPDSRRHCQLLHHEGVCQAPGALDE